MSGRAKIKVYQYDKDGKFVKQFESINDVRKEHYPNDKGKRPILDGDTKYHIVKDGSWITKERIGREGIRELKKRIGNEYINIKEDDKMIKVYNIDNKSIAVFKNIQIAHKLTNISLGTIWSQLNKGKGYVRNGLTFKYVK